MRDRLRRSREGPPTVVLGLVGLLFAAIGLLLAAIGSAFVAIGLRGRRAAANFERRAVSAPGEVTDVRWERARA